MGWWHDKNGNLLGDAPIDRAGDWLDKLEAGGAVPLSSVLAAIDRALRRNASHFLVDPTSVAGRLGAYPKAGRADWQADDVDEDWVESCHEILDRIAIDYLDNGEETLPKCAELLQSFTFVVAPRIPERLLTHPDFDLQAIEYASSEKAMVKNVRLEDLEPVLERFDVQRDADRQPQQSSEAFVSWTRQPELSLEVDWTKNRDGSTFVEIRGLEARRLSKALEAANPQTKVINPEAALANLLTVPPADKVANPDAANARWHSLCAVLAADPDPAETAFRALVTAGLSDTDWRVRMTAVWAAGHHRMPDLPGKIEAAKPPDIVTEGITSEDRRVFLALKALSAARSAGVPFHAKPSADASFVDEVERSLDTAPTSNQDGPAGLIGTLLRRFSEADGSNTPPRWSHWSKIVGDR